MTTAFPMLNAPPRASKPRTKALTFLSEVGISLRATEDLLETAHMIIDCAKITDHLGLIERLSEPWLRKKIALYERFGIPVLPGGVPFQIAVLQGVVEEYLKRVRDLGFVGVELSEDVIPPLARAEREDFIGRARSLGLKVTTEVGRKNRDVEFDPQTVKSQILSDVELGVANVYIESSEIQALSQRDAEALDGLAALGGGNVVLFELGLKAPQEKAAWLVERYGPLINFASVSPHDIVAVDAIRVGMHRMAGYHYLSSGVASSVVKSRN
jgi:phosphosulfolactate synthase